MSVLITEGCQHVWVEGATPLTFGASRVDYCGLCGICKPVGGAVFVGVVQTTLDGWRTLKTALTASEGVT